MPVRIEQKSDGTLVRLLDTVEINLYARILKLGQAVQTLYREFMEKLDALSARVSKAEADLKQLRAAAQPHVGRFYAAGDLIRGSASLARDSETNRTVLAGSSGLLGRTYNLTVIPGRWKIVAFVRGPVRIIFTTNTQIIATRDDLGTDWRSVELVFDTLQDGEVEVYALGEAAVDYVMIRMGD